VVYVRLGEHFSEKLKEGVMKRLVLGLIAAAAVALLAAACGGGGETKIVEVTKEVEVQKEVIKEVPKEVVVTREVVKEVEKEVIKEVPKEVVVTSVMEKEVVVTVEKVVEIIATPTRPPAGTPEFGGSLRIVSQASVATLDGYWTQAYVTAAVASHIWEQPFGWAYDLTEQPQMVSDWSLSSDNLTYTFNLRPGLKFHDNTDVTANDVVVSLTRWLGGQDAAAGLMRDFVTDPAFVVVDNDTFTANLKEPFGAVRDGMARPWSGVFVMPARIANVPSSTQVTEYIGSSPYKFSKWDQGNQIVLERFDGYVPDTDPASGYVGAHVAYLDELIWLEIPDEETKIAGLETGEWDVVDGAGLDFYSRLNSNSELTVPLYKPGHRSAVGFIPTHPPFDDLVLRRAMQRGMDYASLMASLGPDELWDLCSSWFYCGTQWETNAGGNEYYWNNGDVAEGKKLVEESSYAGEEIVYLNPTDYATLTPLGIVAKAQMVELGINVEMPALDWATVVTQLGDPDAFHAWTSWGVHWCCGDPIRASIFGGDQAFWPKVPKIQRLRREFAQAVDFAAKYRLIEEIQVEGYEAVLWVEPGVFYSIYPTTADLKNFEVRALPYYINTWLTR
jgi:peptide/nickel transport system substrate-binding protein